MFGSKTFMLMKFNLEIFGEGTSTLPIPKIETGMNCESERIKPNIDSLDFVFEKLRFLSYIKVKVRDANENDIYLPFWHFNYVTEGLQYRHLTVKRPMGYRLLNGIQKTSKILQNPHQISYVLWKMANHSNVGIIYTVFVYFCLFHQIYEFTKNICKSHQKYVKINFTFQKVNDSR